MKLKKLFTERIPLFLNEKYCDILFDYLRDIKRIMVQDEEKNKKSLFETNEKEYKKITKNWIYKCFRQIGMAIFQKEKYFGATYSHLELAYLKFKAKFIHRKINLLAIELRKRTDLCVEYYIKICKHEFYRMNKREPNLLKHKSIRMERRKSINSAVFHLEKINRNDKKEINNDSDFKFEEEEENKKIINLFIGKFDINKILKNQQTIELKKGGFVNAFIIKNIKDTENEYENNVIHFKTPLKNKFHNIISPVKLYRENSEKKKFNIKTSATSKFEESDVINPKILISNKLKKKKLILQKNTNYTLSFTNNKLNFHKRNNTYLTLNCNTTSTQNKTKNTLLNEFKTIQSTKRLPNINFNKIKTDSNSNSINKNNSILHFLSRKDLYY